MRHVQKPSASNGLNLFDLISDDSVSFEEFGDMLRTHEALDDQPKVEVRSRGSNSEETWDDILTMFAEAFDKKTEQQVGSDSSPGSASGFMEIGNLAAAGRTDQQVDQRSSGEKLLESESSEDVTTDEENQSDFLSSASPDVNMSSPDSQDFDAGPPSKRFRPSYSASEGRLNGSNSHFVMKL